MRSPFYYFRKYQKAMLAVFVVALVIVFTFSLSGVTPLDIAMMLFSPGGGSGSGDVAVSFKGGSLSDDDLYRIRDRRNVLVAFQQEVVRQAYVLGAQPDGQILGQGDSDRELLQAHLLAKQADEMGMVVTDDAVNDFLAKLSGDTLSVKIFEDILDKRLGGRVSQSFIFDALRQEIAAANMGRIALSGLSARTPSGQPEFAIEPARVWQYFQRLNRELTAEIYPVNATDFVADVADKVGEPSETQLQEFFDQYKERLSYPDDPEPGFKQRKRIKLAFFQADFNSFLDEEKTKIADEVVETYYQEHLNEFRKPELPPEPSDDDDSSPDDETDAADGTESSGADSTDDGDADTTGEAEAETTGEGEVDTTDNGAAETSDTGETTDAGDETEAGPSDGETESSAATTGEANSADAEPDSAESQPSPEAANGDQGSDPADKAGEAGEEVTESSDQGTEDSTGTAPEGADGADTPPAKAAGETTTGELEAGDSTETAPDSSRRWEHPGPTGESHLFVAHFDNETEQDAAAGETGAGESSEAEAGETPAAEAETEATSADPAAVPSKDATASEVGGEGETTAETATPDSPATEAPKKEDPPTAEQQATPGDDVEEDPAPPTGDSTSDPPTAEESDPPPAEKKVEYRSLDQVREQILRDFALKPAQDRIEEALNLAYDEMYEYYQSRVEWTAAQVGKEPKLPDREAMAKRLGLKFDTTSNVDIIEIDEYPIGQAQQTIYEEVPPGSGREVPRNLTLKQEAFDGLDLYRPIRFPGATKGGSGRPDSTDVYFLYWVTEEKEEHVPELADVRDLVLEAWTQREARRLAQAQADKLAEQAKKSGLSLVAEIGEEKVIESGSFQFFNEFSVLMARAGQGRLMVSQIPGVEGIAEPFMETVFDHSAGDVFVAANQPESSFFVVRIKTDRPNQEVLREKFLNSYTLGMQRGIPRDVQMMASKSAIDFWQTWFENFEKEMEVQWRRTPQPGSQDRS